MAHTISHLREKKEDFTVQQYESLHDMLRLVNEAVAQMMVVISGRRENLSLTDSRAIEHDINELRDQLKADTVTAVNSHQYSYNLGTLYNELLADCEKIGDYVMNIVEARLGKHTLDYRGLQLNLDKKTATIDGNPINLTPIEFALLQMLLSNSGKVLSRQQLMESVWTGIIVTDRTIDVNITRLRKKLNIYAANIVSRPGFGYLFEEQPLPM